MQLPCYLFSSLTEIFPEYRGIRSKTVFHRPSNTQCNSVSRGGSRTAATSKMEHFVIIVNGWKPLTIITKCSILDVAAVLDPPLVGCCHKRTFLSSILFLNKLQEKGIPEQIIDKSTCLLAHH